MQITWSYSDIPNTQYSRAQELFYKLSSKITNALVK